MDDFWKTLLWQQFGAAIDMLENAMHACPDDLWSNADEKPAWVKKSVAGAVHTRRIGSVGIASRATLYKG